MGAILDMARSDARRYINSGGFNQELIITPAGLNEVRIQGLANRHSTGYDTDGQPVVSDNIHCSFSELDLNDLGVETRNSRGDLIIKDWLVEFTDGIGAAKYKISESYPDGTLGIIRCTLTHYE